MSALNAALTLLALGRDARSTARIAADLDVETVACASVLRSLKGQGLVDDAYLSGATGIYWRLTKHGERVAAMLRVYATSGAAAAAQDASHEDRAP